MTTTNKRLADEAQRLAHWLETQAYGSPSGSLRETNYRKAAALLRGQPPEPEPVDPVIIGVREILAAYYTAGNFQLYNKEVEQGIHDNGVMFQAASKVLSRLLSEAEARGRAVVVPEEVLRAVRKVRYILGQDDILAAAHTMSDYILSLATPKPKSPNVEPDYMGMTRKVVEAYFYHSREDRYEAAAAVLKREIEALREGDVR